MNGHEVPIAPRSVYEADPGRAVDGDTVHVPKREIRKVRLLGVDTAEMRGGTSESRALARQQQAFVAEWMGAYPDLIIDVRGMDDLSRELAWVWGTGPNLIPTCLNDEILKKWPGAAADARVQWVQADFAVQAQVSHREVRVDKNRSILTARHDAGVRTFARDYRRELVEQAVERRRVA